MTDPNNEFWMAACSDVLQSTAEICQRLEEFMEQQRAEGRDMLDVEEFIDSMVGHRRIGMAREVFKLLRPMLVQRRPTVERWTSDPLRSLPYKVETRLSLDVNPMTHIREVAFEKANAEVSYGARLTDGGWECTIHCPCPITQGLLDKAFNGARRRAA